MAGEFHRRRFLRGAAAAVAVGATFRGARVLGANERLNIGVIGVGGRGAGDLDAVAHENIVALCDVDSTRLGQAASQHPRAKTYADYRQLLEQNDLDAVVVATPDHHHAPATVRALRRGLAVYCEKPLTHTVREARLIAQLAAEKKVATQMGTQNHAHPGYLRTIELLRAGAIGHVREVHVITDRPGTFWKQGLAVPTDRPPIPKDLDWNLWLGPAAERDYHPAFAPFAWRGWWDFGCGAIGDMAIHLMDPIFWGLEPLTHSTTCRVTSVGSPRHPASGPTWMITTIEFGSGQDQVLNRIVWYEGEARPPADIAADLPMNGLLFVGDDGRLAVVHGEGMPRLLPEDEFRDYKWPDPWLPESPGHHQEWIHACKSGTPTGSNFLYAAPFTEIVLLGNVAFRSGGTIEWDHAQGKIINRGDANHLLDKEYRKGWEVG